MTHSEIQEALAIYRDLRGAEREELDRHVAACAECSARLDAYLTMDRELSYLRDARPDSRLRQQFYAAIGDSQAGTSTQLARRPRPLLLVARFAGVALLFVVLLGAWAVWQGWLPGLDSTASRPFGIAVPTPRSSLVGSLLWQTDGAHGYGMLRPADWKAAEVGDLRSFRTAVSAESANALAMTVSNLQARAGLAQAPGGVRSVSIILSLFEKNPTFAGWTAGIEQSIVGAGGEVNVVRSLPSARIYLTFDAPGGNSPQLMLSAYKVDGGQPLVITLVATGAYAGLDRLEAEGIVDDLATMVESAHAIPVDTNNVVPWLRTATPTPALEVSTPVATLEPPRVATPTIALLATDHPEADGWTRYTAPSTGLSFAYPSGWRLAAPSGQLSPGAMLPYQLIAPFNDFPGGNKVEIIYLSYEIRPEQSLADWVAVYERAEGTPPETASTQAGIIAEPDGREHDYLQQVVKDVWGTSQNFFLRQGRLVILLQASTTEQYAEGMAAALESILGTFRFAPSAATTLNELYGTNRQWPTLDDYLRMVQPAETPASRCDVVCQDATASAALALTPVTTVTQSPSFRATEEVYNQRLSATQTRQAQIIPTPTPTPTTTPTPRPAGPGLAIYDGASTYNPLPKFQLVYTTNEWKQSEEGLDHQAIAGCSLALHPPARGMVGPTTQRQAYFGGYTWDAKIWVQEGVIGYTLNTDNRYFLLELRWPKDGEQSVRNQCEQAGEKVLDTFRMVG